MWQGNNLIVSCIMLIQLSCLPTGFTAPPVGPPPSDAVIEPYVPPKTVWLYAMKTKGLEISGTFARRSGGIFMDLQFTNKALQAMSDFVIQFNRNSFGLAPAAPLKILTPLAPSQSTEVSLPLNTVGPVMKMDPLNSLQVAVKNNINIFYFGIVYPLHILFVEDGKMDKMMFLNTWHDIPKENEAQFQIKNCPLSPDTVRNKLEPNNFFTVAQLSFNGQIVLYQSIRLTNRIWVLAQLSMQPTSHDCALSLKCQASDVLPIIFQAYETVLKN